MQSITVEPTDNIIWLPAGPFLTPSGHVTNLVVLAACFMMALVALVAFQALLSSAISFFIVWLTLTGDAGHAVATRGEARLSTATAETYLGVGVL